MNKREYLDDVMSCDINMERVDVINKKYNVELNKLLSKVISYARENVFFEKERRVLCFEEIKDASDDYEVDFVEMGILPVIDAYDNTFIVYSFEDDLWAMYNISDDILFDENKSLEEIL